MNGRRARQIRRAAAREQRKQLDDFKNVVESLPLIERAILAWRILVKRV